MRLEYNLELRQTQKLLMTPQLRQAIKLLQLPVMELGEYLCEQYLENPLLEVDDNQEEPVQEQPEETSFDIDWEQYFQDRSDTGEPLAPRQDTATFEAFTGCEYTLQEKLLAQLNLVNCTGYLAGIAAYIINNLDDSGYLSVPCAEIADNLGISVQLVEMALSIVQALEPPGIGARDIRECLQLQLAQRQEYPSLVQEIIQDYLELVAKGKVPILAEKLSASTADVQRAIDYIRTLDPKPGLSVADCREAGYVYPDITVLDVAGEWVVLVNDSNGPRLRLNPMYQRMISVAETEETKKFLRERLNSAVWLLKAVEQRRSTLQRITEHILEYQKDFFKSGAKHLRPLRLKDVAEALGVHESTVSRAINGKYAQTPRGIFELKYFFSVNLETRDGEGTSSTGVKKVLQELIDQEDATSPRTDQDLAELLQQKGVRISRRTVAKYREELGIASSNMRRRWD